MLVELKLLVDRACDFTGSPSQPSCVAARVTMYTCSSAMSAGPQASAMACHFDPVKAIPKDTRCMVTACWQTKLIVGSMLISRSRFKGVEKWQRTQPATQNDRYIA